MQLWKDKLEKKNIQKYNDLSKIFSKFFQNIF